METPLLYELQDDESKAKHEQLFNTIHSFDSDSSEAEILALNERVCREVTSKPILARIVKGNISLLLFACFMLDEQFHPAIKCLIEANPSALLGKSTVRAGRNIIHDIAGHPTHCVLFPWIADNYKWVLDHERCLEFPPVFDLILQYVYRESVPTRCTDAVIQQLFEAYPQGLTQVDDRGITPLHLILMGSAGCEADLFMWMAKQCSSNMLKRDDVGWTPLHIACFSLAYYLEDDTHHVGDDSRSEICKYIIAKCPKSVRILDNKERLPVHHLVRNCQHPLVKEVVVCLLREYPESYDMDTARGVVEAPSSTPFIQRIKPLLDEERELKENIAYLPEVSGVFQDAVKVKDNPSLLASSTCDAFSNWATITFVQRLEARLEQVLTDLQDECNVEEERD